jgi:hypothetical protein
MRGKSVRGGRRKADRGSRAIREKRWLLMLVI